MLIKALFHNLSQYFIEKNAWKKLQTFFIEISTANKSGLYSENEKKRKKGLFRPDSCVRVFFAMRSVVRKILTDSTLACQLAIFPKPVPTLHW